MNLRGKIIKELHSRNIRFQDEYILHFLFSKKKSFNHSLSPTVRLKRMAVWDNYKLALIQHRVKIISIIQFKNSFIYFYSFPFFRNLFIHVFISLGIYLSLIEYLLKI